MGYPPVMPPRIDQPHLHPQPTQPEMSASNPGRSNEYYAYTRGMSLPPSTEQRPFYRTTYGPLAQLPNQNPIMQEQMSLSSMNPSMADHQMSLGPYPYGQASGSRRPAPDEDEDITDRKNKRRAID